MLEKRELASVTTSVYSLGKALFFALHLGRGELHCLLEPEYIGLYWRIHDVILYDGDGLVGGAKNCECADRFGRAF